MVNSSAGEEWDTPGKFADPNSSFHPKFNLGPALDSLRTPENERGRANTPVRSFAVLPVLKCSIRIWEGC